MMISTIAGFAGAWKHEVEITSRVLGALTDASLAQRVTPNDRTLGEIAWHLVVTIPEMARLTGLAVEGPAEDAPCPASASAIASAYGRAATSLLAEVKGKWTDATLQIEDEMYGQRWTRGVTLGALIVHQVHHRGAMSVLMRQAALRPPDIYGPTRETMEEMKRG